MLFPIVHCLTEICFLEVSGVVCKSQAPFKNLSRNFAATLATEGLTKRKREYFDDIVSAGDLPAIVAFLYLDYDLFQKLRLVQVMLLAVVYDFTNHLG